MPGSTDRDPLTSKARPKDFGSTSRKKDQKQQSQAESDAQSEEMALNKYETWAMPLCAEFVGQLLFAFTHSMAAQSVPVVASAINDGFFVAIMVITIGHISGAHVNSAVSVAVAIAGGMKWIMLPLYITVQLLGSLAGAALAYVANGTPTGAFELGAGITVGQGILCEIMMSILLVLAVLMTAVDAGSPLAAFAIGFSIVIDIFLGARISGSCMNPSLSFGPAVVAGKWENYWIYWVGPLVGALIAVGIHKLLLGSRQKRLIFNEDGDVSNVPDAAAMKRRDGGESNSAYKEETRSNL